MKHTVYTAIFGKYELLKEPNVITKGWKYVCYSDQEFMSDVWDVIHVETPEDPRLEARKHKALFHNYVDTEFSLWIDGSFLINTNLDDFWNKYFKAPFSAPIHPQRDCVYEEAEAIIQAQRGGRKGIESQIESYKGIVPAHNGLITSGILLRQMTWGCINMCEDWYKETSKPGNSHRDQVSFAKVSMGKNFHTFDYRYATSYELLYHPHRDIIVNGINFI